MRAMLLMFVLFIAISETILFRFRHSARRDSYIGIGGNIASGQEYILLVDEELLLTNDISPTTAIRNPSITASSSVLTGTQPSTNSVASALSPALRTIESQQSPTSANGSLQPSQIGSKAPGTIHSSDSSQPEGLSDVAKAGIAVGIVVSVLFLLGFLVLSVIIKRRGSGAGRRQSRDVLPEVDQEQDEEANQPTEREALLGNTPLENPNVISTEDELMNNDLCSKTNQLYHHLPLDPTSDEIRLFTIEPNAGNQIEGSLIVVRLSEQHPESFIPLSYAWGDEKATQSITIKSQTFSDQNFPISANLLEALQRLRHLSRPRTYWIDAICINQAKNDKAAELEKTSQLRRVRDIYSHASKTFVWLGEETHASNSIIDYLTHAGLDYASLRDDCERKPREWRYFATDILERPWFSRLWVVQELIMSQDVEIICGSRHIVWDILANAHLLAVAKNILLNPEGLRNTMPLWLMITLRREGVRDHRKMLALWIEIFGLQRCKDPRDSVLALLGLASDRDSPVLKSLGYHQSREEIFTKTTQHILSLPGDVDFICTKPSWMKQKVSLPSWVPDYSLPAEHQFIPRKAYFHQDQATTCGFDASNRYLTHRLEGSARQFMREANTMLVFRPEFLTISTTKGPRYLAQFHGRTVDTLEDVGTHSPRRTEIGGAIIGLDSFLEDAIKVFIGTGHPEDTREMLTYPGTEHDETYASTLAATLTFSMDERQTRISPKQFMKMPVSSAIVIKEEWQQHRLVGYKAVSTGRKMIGLVPCHAERGDKICIVYGCSVPLVLRDITEAQQPLHQAAGLNDDEDRIYRLVGPCYIHGIMYGEALRYSEVMDEILTIK